MFEPRYLAMVEDALGAGRMFGMVQPDKRLARGDTGPGLYRTGCLGRISSFSETDDGRYLITLSGLIRFTIVEEIEPVHGYRRVRAALAGYAADLHEPGADTLPFERAELLEALRRYFANAGVDANWEAIAAMPDAALWSRSAWPALSTRRKNRHCWKQTTKPSGPARCWHCWKSMPSTMGMTKTTSRKQAEHETEQDIRSRTSRSTRVCWKFWSVPLTRGPLTYDRERGELISAKAGLAYPIRNGIPIMLADEARSLES